MHHSDYDAHCALTPTTRVADFTLQDLRSGRVILIAHTERARALAQHRHGVTWVPLAWPDVSREATALASMGYAVDII